MIYTKNVIVNQKKKGKKEPKESINPFDKTWIDKYLILVASIASLFGDKRSFDLSDCGSHLLEHLFGMIRRFSTGDDSQERFDQSLEKAIFLRKWLNKLDIAGRIPGRIPDDSAAKVESLNHFDIKSCYPFGSYVVWAIKIFINLFGDFILISNKITKIWEQKDNFPTIVDLSLNFESDSPSSSSSENSQLYINIRGNINDKRLNTISQDNKLSKIILQNDNSSSGSYEENSMENMFKTPEVMDDNPPLKEENEEKKIYIEHLETKAGTEPMEIIADIIDDVSEL